MRCQLRWIPRFSKRSGNRFPMAFAKFLQTAFSQATSWQLMLKHKIKDIKVTPLQRQNSRDVDRRAALKSFFSKVEPVT